MTIRVIGNSCEYEEPEVEILLHLYGNILSFLWKSLNKLALPMSLIMRLMKLSLAREEINPGMKLHCVIREFPAVGLSLRYVRIRDSSAGRTRVYFMIQKYYRNNVYSRYASKCCCV